MALSLMQILKYVARAGGERPHLATFVRVSGLKVGRPRSKPDVERRVLAKTWSIEGSGKRRYLGKYVTTIDYLKSKTKPGVNVRVSCSCGDFWARWEYALWRKGAAEIVYSDGEPSDVTNPRYIPACCVAKGSYVLTDTGSKLIEDVVPGDKLLTLNGVNVASDAGLTRRAAHVVVLHTADRQLPVTPDHPVLVVRARAHAPEWARADSIRVGDHLVDVLPGNAPDASLRAYEAAGFFMAEHDESTGEPIDAYERPYVDSLFREVTGLACVGKNRLNVSGKALRVLTSKVGFDPRVKRVPEELFLDRSKLASFMRGAWTADGWVSSDKTLATLATVSRQLADDYARALRTLGIRVNVTVNTRSAGSDYSQYLVRIADAASWQKNAALLAGSPKEPIRWDVLYDESANRLSPFHPEAVREKVHAHLLQTASKDLLSKDDLVQVTSLTSLASVRDVLGDHMTRVTFPHADKPCFAASTKAIHAAKLIADVYAKRVLRGCATKKRYPQFLAWLSASGATPKFVEDFYRKWLRDTLSYPTVTDITESVSDVYDITVPDAGHFTANGLVVHNCKHIIKLTDAAFRAGHLNEDFTLKL